MIVTRTLLALVAVFAMGATATGTLPAEVVADQLAQRSVIGAVAKGPLALLGGPEGIAISLLLDTTPGQEAEAFLEKEAEAAAKPIVDMLKEEAKKHAMSEVQYFTELTQHFKDGKTGDLTRRGFGPLAVLGGPEGIAISLLLDTKPGQDAENYLEGLAEKAGMDALSYLKGQAKKSKLSPLQYFTELTQKFKSGKMSPASRRGLTSSLVKGPLAMLGGPEGIAISLLMDTKPGQEAESYLEGLAEKAGTDALTYLKDEAKKSKVSPLQYFVELTQKFK